MWQLIVGAVNGFMERRHERQIREQEARQAWEERAGRSMENGWKDEYITVIITLPILQSFIGNLLFAVTGNDRILLAQEAFLRDMGTMMDTQYGTLMFAVALAAVGIKGFKALK